MQAVLKAGKFLARPQLMFYLLIWMMVILIGGTIDQKYVGLYAAQNIWFFSWVIWAGPIPLPGGLPVMTLITLSLVAKLVFASTWSRDKAGIIITHIGALTLLIGGFITYVSAVEGNMVLFPSERADYFSAYHDRTLTIEDRETGRALKVIDWSDLQPGKTIAVAGLPIQIEIIKLCRNCAFVQRDWKVDSKLTKDLQGRAQEIDFVPKDLEKDDEVNQSAIEFRLTGSTNEKDGVHFSADFISASPWFAIGDKSYNIALRKKRTALPFSVELVEFKKDVHPGTDMARAYSSDVIIREQGTEWRALIQMNEPLRYRGYTFYQSSFLQDGERQGTVLAVVKNSGRLFPYIASIVMCIGLLLHLILMIPGRTRGTVAAALLVLGLLWPGIAQAKESKLDFTALNEIPVLDHGRLKPLDTFARSWLETFYGADALPNMSATAWLMELLFDPETAYNRPIFKVNDIRIRDTINLPVRADNRYSYRDISDGFYNHQNIWRPLFDIPQDKLSAPQRLLLELYDRMENYARLSRSLSPVFPDFALTNPHLLKSFGMTEPARVSYMDLRAKQDVVGKLADKLAERMEDEDDDIRDKAAEALNDDDRAVMRLITQIHDIERDRISTLFQVFPPSDDNPDLWRTPWVALSTEAVRTDDQALLNLWASLYDAYHDNDSARWQVTAQELRNRTLPIAAQTAPTLSLETLFNAFKPFHISFALYLVGFILLLTGYLISPRVFGVLALGCILAALAVHVTGLGTRMVIMNRPPVSNLYESIIFVGVIAVAGALWLEYTTRNSLGLLMAAVLGSLLQLIGIKFDAEGDTMGMLSAVLNTNFWLATHVVVITMGYGISLLVAVLGHLYLGARIIRPAATDIHSLLVRQMHTVALVAIFFTALGTILGGIWADQSWGRFWGWDPKENGALLIVLWLIWMVHGRYAGQLREIAFMATGATSAVIVACAWFGVNLLGVGLHSYGFTQSAMTGFVAFILSEGIVILGMTFSLLVAQHKSLQP